MPVPLRTRDNGDATFANINIGDLSLANITSGKYSIGRDLESYAADISPLDVVTLKPHGTAVSNGNPAVGIYRAAPEKLSAWGLYVNRNNRWAAAEKLIEYDLNTPLFSDYTLKHRYVRLPANASITWNDTDSLEFPVGTVIAKTFAYPDETDDRTLGERFMETRIEHLETSGWYGYSYIWNEDQSDATLSLGGGVVDVSWKHADGSLRNNNYQIPNANQCLSCHNRNNKYVPLGTTDRNLNRSSVTRDSVNQLAIWAERGLLKACPSPEQQPKLAAYDDVKSGRS